MLCDVLSLDGEYLIFEYVSIFNQALDDYLINRHRLYKQCYSIHDHMQVQFVLFLSRWMASHSTVAAVVLCAAVQCSRSTDGYWVEVSGDEVEFRGDKSRVFSKI